MNETPEFAAKLQACREAINTLNEVPDGDLGELFDARLRPEVFAQILMNHLPFPGVRMEPYEKRFWLAVADWLGPDHIDAFRHVGGFMHKVDEF